MTGNPDEGIKKLAWAREHMAVLHQIREGLKSSGSLKGKRIAMALHVEAKTGILALTLKEAGAEVRLASCNPLSTDDDVSLALNQHFGLETHARYGESRDEYYNNLNSVLDIKPDIIIDDGMDMISLVHTDRAELLDGIIGANEETTTGIVRLKAMEKDGALKFPVMNVNDALMKHLFDNRYGTGQSSFDGIFTATNLLVAGRSLVVGGYGWCGRGIAFKARGLGARVTVTEINPVKATEALLDGFEVKPMLEAVRDADFIISATGCKDVVAEKHLEVIKDGCLMANSGHFDNEISKEALAALSTGKKEVRRYVEEFHLKNGKKVYLLGDGRLINLVAGQGHPAEIMDMSFAVQAACAEHLVLNHDKMENRVYSVPDELDQQVAKLRLSTLGIKHDKLTPEQESYINSWQEGT
jgi:adenosylhomocysteinase